MDSAISRTPPSSPGYVPAGSPLVKLIVAGGFGVGKTTLIQSVSEVRSLHTEEALTAPSALVDRVDFTPDKTSTTVSMDFGRLTLSTGAADPPVLYLFGTPGQTRFKQVWEDLAYGAHGALLILDLRRPDDSYDALDLVERSGVPYVVAVNDFPDAPYVPDAQVRAGLDLADHTPLIHCNARDRNSSIDALIALVRHVLDTYRQDAA
ncbi:GTP-binding protein [Kitasatospora albolonga]|uniref:ATP/GTP-binding protein n=2 Tax=Streptomycetaceae TaxID=2062 RepID=A0ABU2VUN3_9ACTN|nr:ATP/GTP-binding protein [Streptomyces griseus]ARF70923.1 ATP-binding protein [Kitasatospora albolonga]MDT0489014.1 ATP/GTP-binding protein [Streptomyces griseus]